MSGEPRKPWYGDGEQPWDTIVRLGWAPEFAASNVLKYLRRTKEPEHSLESARWYHMRLLELVQKQEPGSPWILRQLYETLSPEERGRLTNREANN